MAEEVDTELVRRTALFHAVKSPESTRLSSVDVCVAAFPVKSMEDARDWISAGDRFFTGVDDAAVLEDMTSLPASCFGVYVEVL